mgnify:CR=1 FL=1
MLDFIRERDRLILGYEPDFGNDSWVDEKLSEDGQVTVAKIFTFERSSLLSEEESERIDGGRYCFVLGIKENGYFRISKDVLGLNNDLFISQDFPIGKKTFIASRGISIFRKIDRLVSEQVYIGGPHESAVPKAEFQRLIRDFPTSTELDKYSDSRVTRVLKNYFETMTDAQRAFEEYRNRRETIEPRPRTKLLVEYEINKFELARAELSNMLLGQNPDSFKEDHWQKIILEFVLLLFPKYVAVLPELRVLDFTTGTKPKKRRIDLTLVDANGTLDIIEIKRPFKDCMLCKGKYRDSYIPKRELSGSIMQVEKYIFHLKKWGLTGEKEITEKWAKELPSGMKVNVTNPRGMVILGRSAGLSARQRRDFEVIKRKYSNILDIITYDDLLDRLNNVVARLSRQMDQMSETTGASQSGVNGEAT